MSSGNRGVVIVSGGGAISPFTTADVTASTGFAAGSTDTALRQHLLDAGYTTFTAPATIGPGRADRDLGFGGFVDAPVLLPSDMTINSAGDIDEAGECLARFLQHLHQEWGVDTFDMVAHSMGGLFSRAAYRILRQINAPLRYSSLTTLGTPWEGAFFADYALGDIDLSLASDSEFTRAVMTQGKSYETAVSQGAGDQVTHRYLTGTNGWNQRQVGVLNDVPVVLIAGEYFTDVDASPSVWPHDGLVSATSALAVNVPSAVLPIRSSHSFPDVHSIFFTDHLGLPMERAITWDPDVLSAVVSAIESA
jgi:pimeloyl-ACP methyl ester carboxylesterase